MMVLIIEEAEAVSPPMQRNILGELPVRATNTILQRCSFFDEEGKKKVVRHQRLRKIKAF